MLLGIPRGFFYYEYIEFIRELLQDTDVKIISGMDNNEEILDLGRGLSVDEACLPIKLFIGQTKKLCGRCDMVLIPRVMKDCSGRWLCPKLLGLPEFAGCVPEADKLLITAPLYFNERKKLKKALWYICRKLNVGRKTFERNFTKAYANQMGITCGIKNIHVETSWEFTPQTPGEGEIILPNTARVLLTGHSYNVYDRFVNGDIMRKLDELGIETVTEKQVGRKEREKAVEELNLMKRPFWESMIRTLGTALCLQKEVDGIIYLSSFSCGPDAVIVEMLKTYVTDIPVMVLKLDEHRGEAGFETRIEAFADMLEKRCVS